MLKKSENNPAENSKNIEKEKLETEIKIKNVKNKKLPNWVIIVIVVASIFVCLPSIFFTGYILYYDFNEEQITTDKINKDLEIESPIIGTYNKENNSYLITGYIKNISDKMYEDIEISYTLYDNSNNIIGTANTYLEKLDKNKTWKFTAEYKGINAKSITHFENSKFTADYETWFD